jgi:acetyltransferase
MTYAIHHYPAALIDVVHLGGERVTIRPVLPQDAPLEQAFVRALSDEARHKRFFSPLKELPPQLLTRFTEIDYRDHLALVAQTFTDGAERIVGDARYIVDDEASADFAIAVADQWRGRGLGRLLLTRLECHAAASGVRQLHGDTLHDNAGMLRLFHRAARARPRHPAHREVDRRASGFRALLRARAAGVRGVDRRSPRGDVNCFALPAGVRQRRGSPRRKCRAAPGKPNDRPGTHSWSPASGGGRRASSGLGG